MFRNESLIKKLGLTTVGLIDAMSTIIEVKKFKKNELIISEGNIQKDFYFLLDGVFRGFFFDIDGKEITDCFGFELGDPVMSCHALGEKAKTNLEAITEVTAAKISVSNLQELMQQFPELIWLYNRMLLDALGRHWNIKEARYRMSATERYLWFLDTYPGLIQYVKAKHVASFLGMTPEYLSRVRKSLKNEI